MSSSIADGLHRVKDAIGEACLQSGRAPESVHLVAVSKHQPVEKILQAYEAGQRDFGENYAQELRDKAAALASLAPEIRWHFIGALQSNKVRHVALCTHAVHTIASSRIAGMIRERAGDKAPLLLAEINIAREAQKSGIDPEEAIESIAAINATGSVIKGLMCMPPFGLDDEENRLFLRALNKLGQECARQGVLADDHLLSMGMSHDFADAIAEGAHLVRVGTAIFGARGETP